MKKTIRGLAVAAGAALAMEARDRRLIRRDPAYATLFGEPLRGRERTVTAGDGTRLHVAEFGPTEGPTIVLVHGWTCVHEFWTYQIRSLSNRYRIVAYDLRGHGRSDAPQGSDFSVHALADDLESVLDACCPQPSVLAGHSLGAMTIVGWAGRHPESVRRRAHAAMLVNAGVGDLVAESLVVDLPGVPARFKETAGRALLAASSPLPPMGAATRRGVKAVTLGPDATPAQIAFCERMVLGTRRDVRAGCGRTLSELALYDALAHLTVPTVVVCGERDRLTPPVHAERLAEHLPELAGELRLARCGHMSPVEAADDVTGTLARLAERAFRTELAAA